MKISTNDPTASTIFRTETRDDCVLLFGAITIDKLVKFTKKQPEGAIMDTDLARMTQATMALGMPEACKALKAKMAGQVLFRTRQANPRLSEEAITWLALGERGSSAEFMFQQLSGTSLGVDYSHPHDPDDLRRCLLMLEAIPELSGKVGAMGSTGPEWQNLAYSWGKLKDTLEAENHKWRQSHGSAPKTYELMRNLIDNAKATVTPKPRQPSDF